MRYIYSLVGLYLIALRAFAQEVPHGVYIPQPQGDETNGVTSIVVVWPGRMSTNFRASFDAGGQVTAMSYYKQLSRGDSPTNSVFAELPAQQKSDAFKDAERWRIFASMVRSNLVMITDNIYVETETFRFIGESTVLDESERPDQLQTLIFQDGERYLAITRDRWMGPEPQIEHGYVIGLARRGEYYFPANHFGSTWTMTQELRNRLEEDKRRLEENRRMAKMEPISALGSEKK